MDESLPPYFVQLPARWWYRRSSRKHSLRCCGARGFRGRRHRHIVHEGRGALYETGFLSGGGLAYRTDTELLTAMRRMVHDRALHDELASCGIAMRMGPWSETEHVDEYLGLIDRESIATPGHMPFPRPYSLKRSNPAPARADSLPWSDLETDPRKAAGIKGPHGMI